MKSTASGGANGRPFFTVKEAAAYCGIAVNTLYRQAKIAAKDGGPPKKKFGRAIRFPKEKFIEWATNAEGAE